MQDQTAKLPPNDIVLERAILGACILEGKKTFDKASDIFQQENCFYKPEHAALWDVLTEMDSKAIQADIITVASKCATSVDLGQIWTQYALVKLTSDVVNTSNIESHCRIVLEKYLARETITVGHNIIRGSYNDDIFEVLEYAENSIFDISVGKGIKEYRSISSIADENFKMLKDQISNPKLLTGVPSGFSSLDMVTGGWQNSDLIILAARPGLGKTAFALNLINNAAKRGIGIGFFTLEMSSRQIYQRHLSITSLVNINKIKTRNLLPHEVDCLEYASNDIKKLPIFVDEEAAISLFNLRSKARRMKLKHNIGLIVVDYLQLMTNPTCKGSREQVVSSIAEGLKALAKTLDIPIIALSQLSRDVEKRGENAKPMLSDLRESGSIEQAANIVMFLNRDDYQKTEAEIDPSLANTAELRIAKNRDGELREIPLKTDLGTQRFLDPMTFEDEITDNPGKIFKNHHIDIENLPF